MPLQHENYELVGKVHGQIAGATGNRLGREAVQGSCGGPKSIEARQKRRRSAFLLSPAREPYRVLSHAKNCVCSLVLQAYCSLDGPICGGRRTASGHVVFRIQIFMHGPHGFRRTQSARSVHAGRSARKQASSPARNAPLYRNVRYRIRGVLLGMGAAAPSATACDVTVTKALPRKRPRRSHAVVL